jgi:ABC-type uncharacterized transport system auxiliary subunit
VSDRPRRPRRARSLALLVACAVALTGCGLLKHLVGSTPIPPREMYRLTLPGDSPADSGVRATDGATHPLDGSLAIMNYVAPGVYAEAGIVYRIDDTQYGAYPDREWAVPLTQQLGVLTERVLARAPLTAGRALFDPPSARSSTYLWRGTIREFEEVDRGSQVLAAVRLDARIVRTDDDSVVWSGSAHIERPARDAHMTGIVQTLSEIAAEAVTELATRARSELTARRP